MVLIGKYKRITPKDLKLNIVGFGYSFSNVGDGMKENGKPYFAVGSVNQEHNRASSVIVFNSAPLCINIGKECKSKATVVPSVLGEKDTGKK